MCIYNIMAFAFDFSVYFAYYMGFQSLLGGSFVPRLLNDGKLDCGLANVC